MPRGQEYGRHRTDAILKYPFQCFLPFRNKSTQPRMWPLFHGFETGCYETNQAFFTLCAILRFVVASAAEAELGVLLLNCKRAAIFCVMLEELGHPQSPIPVNCDNSTAVGIANNTVKRQRSRTMEMRFYKGNMTSSTFLEKRALQIIRVSTTPELTTSPSVLGTSTNPRLSANSLALVNRAL